VVKISPENTETEPFTVSLYETPNESAEYTCLSYCWGGELPIQTTTSTLDLFKHDVAWSILPKTFQDAIQLTSMLGIQYIWIDALCIVQDDELDWARESAKMAEIYSRSYLTIGAALAKNCHVGCFVLQDEQPGLRHEVRDHDPNGSPYSIYVRKTRHDEGPTIDSIEPPPSLLSRAWAFQERLLSPRVVFFAPQEMFYECNTASLCECSLGEAREHIDNVRDRLRDIMSNLEGDRQRLIEVWHELVGIYSSMKLTFQDDILPAISGVAHRIQDWTGSRYHAGVWSHSVVEDLRWTSRSTQKPGPENFLAPTWSWASTGGATKYDAYQGSRILADDLVPQVLDINCTLKSTDTCGGVVAGHIVVRGLLFEAEMNPYPHSLASDDHRHLGVVTRKDYSLSDGILFRFVLDRDLMPPATNGKPGSTFITCLLFDVQRISQDAGSGYNAASALMLRQSPAEEGSYERIGYGRRGIGNNFIMEKAQMRTIRII
jgi:Heterokaryon incompatibility protein (HET)